MPNIASVLKEEIARLSRRELRSTTDGLKKSSGQHRSDIAALKKRVATIESQLKRIEKMVLRNVTEPSVPTPEVRVRFSAKRMQAQRHRLGLSAADAGILLNASAQTIYNWEAGKTRPGAAQIKAIAALRQLRKTDARAIIDGAGRRC